MFKELVQRLAQEAAIADSIREVEIVMPQTVVQHGRPQVSREYGGQDQTTHSTAKEGSVVSAVASETELETGPTQPPKSEPVTPNRDLVCVYEVAAEEFAPMSDQLLPVSPEEESEPVVGREMSAIEMASDQAMPFEVPAGVAVDDSVESAVMADESAGRTATEVAARLKENSAAASFLDDQGSLFENSKRSEKAPEA